MEEAAACYERAAGQFEIAKSAHESARAYVEAAKCRKNGTDPSSSVDAFRKVDSRICFPFAALATATAGLCCFRALSPRCWYSHLLCVSLYVCGAVSNHATFISVALLHPSFVSSHFTWLSDRLSVSLSVCLSARVSLLCICLSVCVSIRGKAIEIYSESGRFLQAGKMLQEVGEIFESEKDFDNAINAFQEAADYLTVSNTVWERRLGCSS